MKSPDNMFKETEGTANVCLKTDVKNTDVKERSVLLLKAMVSKNVV